MSNYDEYLNTDNGQPEPRAPIQGEIPDEMPAELREIWGNDLTARQLIAAWGPEAFWASHIHQLATIEHERQKELEPLRKAYLKKKSDK